MGSPGSAAAAALVDAAAIPPFDLDGLRVAEHWLPRSELQLDGWGLIGPESTLERHEHLAETHVQLYARPRCLVISEGGEEGG